MAFGFIALVAVQLALFALSALLAPKPDTEAARPAGLGDFQFPTATEGRALPIVWGTVEVRAPNVVWYGDLTVDEITEEVKTGLFSSDDVVVGFSYSVGMDFALCVGQVDAITRVEVGDRVVFSGSVAGTAQGGTSIGINAPNLFGGEGKGGGVVGTLRFYGGHPDQLEDSYLAGVVDSTLLPGYNDICHAVWRGGEIGESTSIKPWAFRVERFPNNLGLTPGNEVVRSGDANPAEVLYELLTDRVIGLQIPASEINTASFVAAGNTLATEGNGWSNLTDREQQAQTLIEEVLRQIDAVLYEDSDGRYVLKLIRDDYTLGATPIFDETDVLEVDSFTRGAWVQTQNHVQLTFIDRTDDFKQTAAIAQDLANVEIQQANVVHQVSFPGVKHPTTARDLAARELRQVSFPFAKVKLTVNRRGSSLRPGDVVRFTWAKLGVTEMPLRIIQVDQGELVNGRVTLECVQDIFKIAEVTFEQPQPTNWVPTTNDAAAFVNERAIDCPYWYILTDETLQGAAGERVLAVAERPSGVVIGWRLNVDAGGGLGFEFVGDSQGTTPSAQLDAAYAEDTADVETSDLLVVKNAVGIEKVGDTDAASIEEFGSNTCLLNGEILAFEQLVDNGNGTFTLRNVHRGLLDTLPEAHAEDDRIYFLRAGWAVSNVAYGGTASVDVKNQSETTTDRLALGSAATLPLTFDRRTQRPLPPGNFQVNGSRYPTDVGANDVTTTWAHRNRVDPLALDQNDGDSSLGQDTDVEYVLTFFDDAGASQIRQVVLDNGSPPPTNGTWTSYLYPRADIKADAGASAGPFDLRVELEARLKSDNTLTSRVLISRTFNVDLP